MHIGFETVIVNVAYATYIGATFFNDMMPLRILLIVSSVAFAVFGVVIGVPSIVIWNLAFGAFNAWKLLEGRTPAADLGRPPSPVAGSLDGETGELQESAR